MILTYVDDMRATAGSQHNCWAIMHVVSTKLCYLGIQVALRKTRPPSQQPGPWSGAMILTGPAGIGVKATQEKWEKVKGQLQKTLEWIDTKEPIPRKELESIRGSLVYLQRTYPSITPYVKGYHLTIDSWRWNRDLEGWVIPGMQGPQPASDTPPTHVQPVPRFRQDVLALLHLFQTPEPPIHYVRSKSVNTVCYGYADASGTGFGATVGEPSRLHFTHGTWTEDMDCRSSNYRKLLNLVQTLEEGVSSGRLLESETWIFTDNSTSESVFWKGHSPSRLLNDLALRLRTLEMGGRVRIHMVHVAGSRMIAQGTDGLSRGDLTEGVMTGSSILQYIPLHKSVLDRQPSIKTWISSWLPEASPCWLTPEQWFYEGHGLGPGSCNELGYWYPSESAASWYIWSPPPAIADVAVEELDVSRHKRSYLNHVFLVPRLMTYAWRKRLSKVCDIVLEIPPGTRSFWPADEHEPLLLGLTLHFLPRSPWQAKFLPRILELGRELREVWHCQEGSERHLLCQLCNPAEWLGTV